MRLTTDWHVLGIIGDAKSTTTVVGSESDCRNICEMMVSSGLWGNAWVYPPGSSSDDMTPGPRRIQTSPVPREPYEVYTNTKYCGEPPHTLVDLNRRVGLQRDKVYHYNFDK
jgi:hypothetical protein